MVLPIFVTYGGCACVRNNFSGINRFGEDSVEVVHKISITHKTCTILSLVFIEKSLGLGLSKSNTESADASAELSKDKRN